ncbi:MAG TPA: HIRAN domain-containing protein [Sphingopyxis sp.]|nr:HIRAN domain-containing protein [Sphingopyxis sp.]HMP43923.1 HIRAN domain-containing protein [Sphingopyxis sp.]HMQ18090.1 HIRAN domain-containing protein [Sphingopyxis sp.]
MPKPVKSYPVRLAGTRSYAMAVGWAMAGDAVQLLREPDNPFDADAIVAVDGAGRTLGYVPRDNWLRRALVDEGRGAAATVAESELGGLALSVTLTGDGPIGARDFVPAD